MKSVLFILYYKNMQRNGDVSLTLSSRIFASISDSKNAIHVESRPTKFPFRDYGSY